MSSSPVAASPSSPLFSGRRETLRRLALLGMGGAALTGYGALVGRALTGPGGPSLGGATAHITHQLGWLKGVQFAGEFLAAELGYLEEEGISADYTSGGPGTDYRTLVASGRMMVSESSPLSIIEGAVSGQPLVSYAAVMQRDPGAIMSRSNEPITSLREMVGRTIGVPASVRKLMAVLLKRARIDIDRVNFVPVGTDPGMLASGQIDGYYSHATTAVPGLRALGMDPHVLYMDQLGVPGYAQAFIVRQNTLAEKHDMLVGYTRALIKGWRYFVDNPEASARLIVQKWAPGGTRFEEQLAQAIMMRPFILGGDAQTKGLLWINPEVFEIALGFARDSGTAPRGVKVDIDKLVTQSVIKEALQVA